eukprot:175160-Prorocentrum_lima.AAC.1
MSPLPQMNTPPRLSALGASSNVPGQLGFSPAATTPRGSPGEAHGWEPGQIPPYFEAWTHNDVDSVKVRKKLPAPDVGTSGLHSLSPAMIRRTIEQW